MLIHPFLSRRKGNFLVAQADALGFCEVRAFKTLKGAQSHAKRVGGVVEAKPNTTNVKLVAAGPKRIVKE